MSSSQPESPADAGFVLLSIAGSAEACRGLVAGLRLGVGEPAAAIAGLDDELERPAFREQLHELIGHQKGLSHVVLGEALAARLRGQDERLVIEADLRLVAEHPVRTASFAFALHAFSRTQSHALEALLAELPAGTRLEDYAQREKVEPEAAGIEVYTPVHDYELKGKGRVAGPVAAVIAARRLLAAQPLAHVERIELEIT